jgi:flagellar assembly protein FliH
MSERTAATEPNAEVRRWQAPQHTGASAGRSGPLTASQLAEIEERAYAEGFERGLAEGRQRGEQEVREIATRLGELFDSIAPRAAILDETMLTQLGELVLVIARQLVRREIHREPGEVIRVIREALDVLPVSDAQIRICVNPEDAALVVEALHPDSIAHSIRVVEDLTLARGGARIETEVSVVDASVEARIGAIAAAVFGDERETGSEAPRE